MRLEKTKNCSKEQQKELRIREGQLDLQEAEDNGGLTASIRLEIAPTIASSYDYMGSLVVTLPMQLSFETRSSIIPMGGTEMTFLYLNISTASLLNSLATESIIFLLRSLCTKVS